MIRKTLFAAAITLSGLYSTNAAYVTVYGVQEPRATPTQDPTDTFSYIKPSVEYAGTETASAIGPGESGRTKYEVKYIHSLFVVHRSGVEPHTVLSEPVTATYTNEQGGNILIQKGDPLIQTFGTKGGTFEQAGTNVECTLDDDRKEGVCIGENLYAILTEVPSGTATVLSTTTETVKTTYTGSVFPIATLSTSNGSRLVTKSTVLLLGTMFLGAFVVV